MVQQDTRERLFESPPAPGEDSNHESVAALFASTYEVHERLAWNGLALVYRVRSVGADDGYEQRAPGRERAVALLPIDCESKPHLLRPFEAQAAKLIGFRDAHVVEMLAAGARHGVPYLVLPYTQGTTLGEEIAHRGAMPWPRALAVAEDVLRALSAAHARGLRHWDLTPSNVLLSPIASGEAPVRVLAMGLAPIVRAMTDTDMTGPTGKGSGPSAAKFLAPELLHGGVGASDGRADIYAVGALIVAMLTGTRPSHASDEALPIVAVKGLSDVVRKAMAKDPNARFATADELLAALEAVGRGDLETVALLTKPPPPAAPVSVRPKPLAATPAVAPKPKYSLAMITAAVAVIALIGSGAYWLITGQSTTQTAATPTTEATPTDPMPPIAETSAIADITDALPVDAGSTADVIADTLAVTDASAAVAALVAVAVADPDAVADAVAVAVADADAVAVAVAVADSAAVVDSAAAAAPLASALPPPLGPLLARIEHGDRLDREALGPLYGYAARRGSDVRGHLVLARAFKNLRWMADLIARYGMALRVDSAGAKRDPRILPDLLDVVAREAAHAQAAAQLVATAWGREALPVIDARLAENPRSDMAGRLQRLRNRIAPPAE